MDTGIKYSERYVRFAFTLAEVLITLGIIGIVAAMTIPTLMNKTQNSEFVTGFKETLSILSSASSILQNDNGGSLIGIYQNVDDALDGFCTKLKCSKKCHTTDTDKTCFHSTDWSMLDGRAGWGDFSVGSSAVLADGMSISIQLWFPNCDLFFGSNRCGQLVIDTNGSKRPNKMGRDMFEMFILDNRVLPNGATGSSQDFATHADDCNPSLTTGWYNGAACAGRIIPEGGMKY